MKIQIKNPSNEFHLEKNAYIFSIRNINNEQLKFSYNSITGKINILSNILGYDIIYIHYTKFINVARKVKLKTILTNV